MDIKVLEGQTLKDIDVTRGGDDQDSIIFTTKSGAMYKMYHIQDCCESVSIEDINGNWDDLIGTPILMAEERTEDGSSAYGSVTYTFYTLRTVKGSVDIRWHGESNGYYSEAVGFVYTKAPDLKPGKAYRLRSTYPENRVEAYFIGQADTGFGPNNYFVTKDDEYKKYPAEDPEHYVEPLPKVIPEPVDDSPIRFKLNEIPQPYDQKALAYRIKAIDHEDWRLQTTPAGYKPTSTSDALYNAFNWKGTVEGEDYWKDVYIMLISKNL